MGYKFRSVILALSIASISSFGAHAQEAVLVNGVQATRVVIGPAVSPMAKIIKAGLRDDYYGAKSGTRAWKNAQGLYYFYGARSFEPMWLQNNGDQVTFSPKAQEIVELFKKAEFEGLRTSDYLTDQLDIDAAQGDPQMLAHVEVAFTDAAILYAKHAAGGRIAPSAVSSAITLHPTRVDLAKLRVDLVSSDNPAALLQSMHPTHKEFSALRAELAKRIAGPKIEQIIVPDGKLMKLGKTDERLPVLRERLGLTLDDPANEFIYDQLAEDAIKDFQTSIGLIADGVVGPATIAALNGAHGASAQDIVANMERWRWLPRKLGDKHVFVNTAAFLMYTRSGGKDVDRRRVIVGKTYHKTPIFSDIIKYSEFNPTWTVTPSIAGNEMLPKLRKDPSYLKKKGYDLYASWKRDAPRMNATQIDWSSVSGKRFPYKIVQPAGPKNALGQVKFLFPNKFNVYLHDTANRQLFGNSDRALSHGCIRVQDPLEFAKLLYKLDGNSAVSKIDGVVASKKTKGIKFQKPIPVHLTYFTSWVKNGKVQTFSDIYGRDKLIANILFGRV